MALRKGTVYHLWTTLQIICCQGSFYINTEESKWTDTPSKCTPATPIIEFGKNLRHLSINDLQWQDTESAWTGYFKATMAFEYTGCTNLSDIYRFITAEQDINKDPSRCFPRCEMADTIGVTEKRCYCLQSPLPKSSAGHYACTDRCKFPKGIACGGASSEYVSIYTINPEVTAEPESNGSEDTYVAKSCFSMETGSGKWETCDKSLTPLCRTKTDKTTTGNYSCSWFDASRTCFSRQEYPFGYSDALSFSNGISTVWTGVFKMEIIFSRNWKGHEKVKVKDYGFTQKDKNRYTLHFTDDDDNKKILCDSGEGGHDTTVPDTSMGSGTAVGICVAVVLIIAAIIATVVYFRKRYINSHRFDKMPESSVTGPDHEYNYPNDAFCRESEPNSPVGTTWTEQSVRNNAGGAEYPDFSQNAESTSQYTDILETGNSTVVSNIKLNPYSYESAYTSYTSCEYIPYNTTCGRNRIGLGGIKINNYDKMGGNSYDVLGTRPTFESGKAYATTSKQESPAAATNTYDTSLLSNEKLKQNQGGITDNIYVVNSDTYNILGNETKQSKTDQLYGMKQVKKFKDILKPGGNENIYNTTSGQSETITVTDNTYAKLGH